jgi:hypothetical protein
MTCFDYPRDSDQVERQVGLGDANEGRRGVGEVDTSRGGKSESESERWTPGPAWSGELIAIPDGPSLSAVRLLSAGSGQSGPMEWSNESRRSKLSRGECVRVIQHSMLRIIRIIATTDSRHEYI